MIQLSDILKISTAEEFDSVAVEVFRFQASECAPYREYLRLVGIDPREVRRTDQIPFLPIELFKTQRVYCGSREPEAIFTSSSTGGEGESRHYVARTADYDRTYSEGFRRFYGDPARWSVYALLPSYLERTGSSLVRMVDGLIRQGRGGGFYLYDHEQLMADMAADTGDKILLGVSYALLDLAERGERLPKGTIVMETGGMKGHRTEIPKEQMHNTLKQAFGVSRVHSEYGMAELMSQAYSAGEGIFRTPPWMRVSARNLADPFETFAVGRGGINITDLANLHSCAFIQTQDTGAVSADGSFTLTGRAHRADIRGCNLLIQ
ncbi:MAG: acyltransferase [Rikenellaceae bacterium]|nr:acyltransferase [Rikenellaceae bacterium]